MLSSPDDVTTVGLAEKSPLPSSTAKSPLHTPGARESLASSLASSTHTRCVGTANSDDRPGQLSEVETKLPLESMLFERAFWWSVNKQAMLPFLSIVCRVYVGVFVRAGGRVQARQFVCVCLCIFIKQTNEDRGGSVMRQAAEVDVDTKREVC